jgi:uncharacterized protein YsxB (DUF464 family)
MTTYEVIRKENESLIEVKGHAGFGPHGEDIVCSAISTACIMTANLIDKMKEKRYNILDAVCEEGYFRLQVNTSDIVIRDIFDNLVDTLDALQKEYPAYLKIKN